MSNPLRAALPPFLIYVFIIPHRNVYIWVGMKMYSLPLIIFPICAIILSTYIVNKRDWSDRMARPSRCRRVCEEPVFDRFAPCGRDGVEEVSLTVDEYEVIRLVDYEKRHMLSVQNRWIFHGQQ